MPDPVIDYDPTKQSGRGGDQVPQGTYEVEFVGTVDRPPFQGGKFAKPGAAPEPRLGFQFRILSGPFVGKTIEQETGSYPASKSKLVYLLGLMHGGALPPGRINFPALRGRRYWLTWSANPESEKGYPHVASLMVPPVGGGQAPFQPQAPQPPSYQTPNGSPQAPQGPSQAPPGSPPGSPPGAPPLPPDREFWIPFENGVRKVAETEIRSLIREGKGPTKVCPIDGKGGWQEPGAFQLDSPF